MLPAERYIELLEEARLQDLQCPNSMTNSQLQSRSTCGTAAGLAEVGGCMHESASPCFYVLCKQRAHMRWSSVSDAKHAGPQDLNSCKTQKPPWRSVALRQVVRNVRFEHLGVEKCSRSLGIFIRVLAIEAPNIRSVSTCGGIFIFAMQHGRKLEIF